MLRLNLKKNVMKLRVDVAGPLSSVPLYDEHNATFIL